MKIKVAPSILSADFRCLASELKRIERAGADMVHIDVMDGHFVPNITIGPCVIKYIRQATRLPLDVHLMIANPQDLLDDFLACGSDMITVHVETISRPALIALSSKMKAKRKKLGISLNPSTPLKKIERLLKYVDFVLVMSVYPGFSGQQFIPSVLPKIKKLRSLFKGDIAVDGGVNDRTARLLIRAGANVLASGSYIFASPDTRKAIERLRFCR
ncbi:MAG: ribulose phosphate epimerase [Omnitrophica WOR_2 bacterium SM23_72]|nr:MAG: ribulose phosphate epimerase [Omnitrophica WOR_2 bacterium SM23_72]